MTRLRFLNSCQDCRPQRAGKGPPPGQRRKAYTVALAGNPNTGKSTVFNALTGLRQHTGNWPGKTVSRAEGFFIHDGETYSLIDLPGTYSLLSASTDEEIARDFLLFSEPDCTLVVADATALERNLNLVFQVMEITDRVILCVNLLDEARRKGIDVDIAALSRELGIPVVGTVANRGEGLRDLVETIAAVAHERIEVSPHPPAPPPRFRVAVDELVEHLQALYPGVHHARWLAYRLIEGDYRIRQALLSGDIATLGREAAE